MLNIIVAIACNLIVVLILVGGIVSTIRAGIRVSGLRLLFTILAGVGAFLIVPTISNALLGLTVKAAEEGTEAILLSNVLFDNIGMTLGLINSIIYLIVFVIFYLIGTLICNISKHCFIKSIRKANKENKARIRRAKSINPKAEREAKRSEFKSMKSEYTHSIKWYGRVASVFMGIISAVIVGFVALIPVGFIFDFLNKDGNRSYLEEGYKYTLNGVIEDNISFDFDGWLVRAEEKSEDTEVEDSEEVKDGGEETSVEDTSVEDNAESTTTPTEPTTPESGAEGESSETIE